MLASSCHILAAGITDDGIAATTCHTVTTRLLHKTCSCEIMMIVIEINMGRLRLLEGRKKSGYRQHESISLSSSKSYRRAEIGFVMKVKFIRK